jgi:hypothetical protein
MAFDAPGEAAVEATIWRVNLPADPDQAHAAMAGAESNLIRSQEVLSDAEGRIDALVQRKTEPVSFGTRAMAEPLDLPEQALLDLLQEAETGSAPVSFGERGLFTGGWEQAVDEFRDFASRASQILTHYAWVETRVGEALLARTTVNWLGDLESAWEVNLRPDQMGLHQRTLNLTLETRALMLRSLILVASGAGKLSVLMTTPGGALLALPAVWKFVNQVRAEWEKFGALQGADG